MKNRIFVLLIVGITFNLVSCVDNQKCTCTYSGYSESFTEDDCDCNVEETCDDQNENNGRVCQLE